MEGFFLEYGNLLLRWLHVIAAIAWIGESIYFVMLDLSLHAPKGEHAKKLGVYGEMWAVHGGGFYHNQKYLTNPAELPDDLHWSFWKSYTTWLSGFGLFMLLYLLRADIYLVNPASPWEWARNMNGTEAGILAVAFLVIGYNVYSRLCRIISPTVERDGLLSIAVGVMMVLVAWLTTPRMTTKVMSRPNCLTKNTVKNGVARFTANCQLARNMISRRKFWSFNGAFSSGSRRMVSVAGGIFGSGVRASSRQLSRPARNPKA